MINLEHLIREFFNNYWRNSEDIEIYNEFSLQHELGLFLRERLKGYKVQFERNIFYFFGNQKIQTIKKEIDIAIFNEDETEKYAIELKNPRNGQVPETMFQCIKDIKFMEELKELGFNSTICVTFVSDKIFYNKGSKDDGIYSYFREGKVIQGKIEKPTGKEKFKAQEIPSITLNRTYKINWKEIRKNNEESAYYIVVI